jgi:hypothetical protein
MRKIAIISSKLSAATMDWVAVEEDTVYVSDAAATSFSVSAVLGQEHHGVFF